jgi:hypothetical protein
LDIRGCPGDHDFPRSPQPAADTNGRAYRRCALTRDLGAGTLRAFVRIDTA